MSLAGFMEILNVYVKFDFREGFNVEVSEYEKLTEADNHFGKNFEISGDKY